jgi:hypothetical protein
MKSKMLTVLGVTAGVLAGVSCAQKKQDSSVAKYSTSFAMGASAAPRSFGYNFSSPIEKLMNMIMPSAIAGLPTSLTDSQSTGVTLGTAWIVVKEIEFKSAETAAAESEDEVSEEVEFKGPYFVNLLSAAPQVLDTKSIPAKVYKRIEMKLEAAETENSVSWPTDAPAGLSGKSMYIEGTYNSLSFSYSSHDGAEFKVSGAGGIAAEEGQDILLSIRFSDIIAKINMTALQTAGNRNISEENRVAASDPCPLIETGLPDLYTCFRKGLESESDFGKDSDGSGELETDEDNCND